MAGTGKFERKLPEDRRRALIDATLRCLSAEGHDGLSIRKISAAAGISVGLINHHYASKERLVSQAYETLTVSMLEAAKAAVDAAGPAPRDRLAAFIRALLSGPALDPGTLRSWMVFWSMIQDGTSLREVHDRTYGDYRRYLETLLHRFAAEHRAPLPDTRLAAIGLLAMIDGLWIEWSLDPRSFTPDEAVRLCSTWVDAALARAAGG